MYSEETDMKTVKFKNSDGTKTVYMYGEDIKYVDEFGEIKDKSNKLTKVNGGYTNEKNNISTLYPDVLSKGITTTFSGYSINVLFGSVDSSKVDSQLDLSAVSKRIIGNNRLTPDTIEYNGIYGEDTYVTYTQNFNGYKENIILEKDIGRTRFPFIIRTNGLKIVNNAQTLSIIDPNTQTLVGEFGTLLMWDSGNNKTYGQYELITIKENEMYGVVIIADSLFEIPNLAYPVTIDPAVYLYVSDNLQNRIIDTTLFTNYSSSVGELQSIVVGNDSTRGTARALVNFPEILSHNDLIQGYNYHVISYMKYHFVSMGNTGSDFTINAHVFNNSWNENSVYSSDLWTGYGNQIGSVTIPASSSLAVYTIPLDGVIEGWLNGTIAQNGIMLKAANENQSANVIGSVEAGYNGNPGLSSYRPFVSFEYLEINNNIFYLRNIGSNQYLTVTGGIDVTNTLIIQGARSLTYREQEFKIVDTGTYGNEFIMRPICSKSGRGRVLGKDGSNQAILTVETNPKATKFSIKLDENGNYIFVTSGGLAMTASNASGGVTTFSAINTTNNYQKWALGWSEYNDIHNYYASLSIEYPLPTVNYILTSGYGVRSSGTHSGFDISGVKNSTPLYSVVDGVVVERSDYVHPDFGYYVIIEANSKTAYGSTQKLRFMYMHMHQPALVYVNQTVSVKQQTGLVGNTGNSYGAHLHFTVIINGGFSSAAGSIDRYTTIDPIILYPTLYFEFPHNNNEQSY